MTDNEFWFGIVSLLIVFGCPTFLVVVCKIDEVVRHKEKS